MTDLEKVKSWLHLCPYLQIDTHVDTTYDWPISAGLSPKEQRVIKRTEDVLGGKKHRIRQSYLLRLALREGEEAAIWLQQIQNWIFTQNINSITPKLGENVSIWSEDGRLERASQVGMSLYVVTLKTEFEVIVEGAK